MKKGISLIKTNKVMLFFCAISGVIIPTNFAVALEKSNEKEVEEIIVTGSRIRQNPLNEKSPIMTLTEEDIERTGLTSLGDLIQKLPISGSPLTTRFNSSGNFGFPADGGGVGAGAAQADLRNLGSKRVLVLVDGVRWVGGASVSGIPGATDLNTIPVSIIERIDVLEDGASSIYGSDAIAGVVNIITKKNYQGANVQAYSGRYDEGGENQEFSLSFGVDEDKLKMFFNLGYVDQKSVGASKFDISKTPIPFVTDGTGGSSGTPQGRFVFTDPNTGTVIDCTLNNGVINDGAGNIPVYSPASPCDSDDFNAFDTSDRFNYSAYNLVLTPSKRMNVYGQVQYQLAENVTFHVKALFNNRKSTNQAAPEPLFIGPDAGNGNLMDTVGVDVTNPYNPFGFSLNADPDNGDVNFIFAGRRPLEGGPRIYRQNVDTTYLGAGFDGSFDIGKRHYYWDANLIWSRNHANQIKSGAYNSRKIKMALGPLDICNADSSCVPLNFFGGQGSNGEGSITQAMLDFISFKQKDISEQSLTDFSINISGDIAELPGGTLAFAVGYEHRNQRGFFEPDAVVVAGDTAGIPAQPSRGGYSVDEYYAEFDIPIISHKPGFDLLDVSIAVRNSDYSNFGNESTSKFGLRWKPTKNFLFRATFAEGLRAPSIGELFGTEARFDQTLPDPCSDMLGLAGGTPASAAIVDNCIALGVPADGSYAQFNPQISVLVSGNEALNPETADSTTIGFAYNAADWVDQLSWIEQLTVEFSYYKHELDKAIQPRDSNFVLNNCVNNLDLELCGFVTRNANGVITRFDNTLDNIGGLETQGWDINFTYLSPEYEFGQFRITWMNTILDEFTEIIQGESGLLSLSREGLENGDPEKAWPEFKSNLVVDWMKGDWRASYSLRYIDEVTEVCPGLAAEFAHLCPGPTQKLDGVSYSDVQLGYRFGEFTDDLELNLGVQNLFNEDPPSCFSCALNGFDAAVYDVPGRFVYLRLDYDF